MDCTLQFQSKIINSARVGEGKGDRCGGEFKRWIVARYTINRCLWNYRKKGERCFLKYYISSFPSENFFYSRHFLFSYAFGQFSLKKGRVQETIVLLIETRSFDKYIDIYISVKSSISCHQFKSIECREYSW